jgi:hypothetical protein
VLASSSRRPVALFGTWLAALSGACFAVGRVLGPMWTGAGGTAGRPVGGTLTRAVEQIGFFTGLGVAIVFVATLAMGGSR